MPNAGIVSSSIFLTMTTPLTAQVRVESDISYLGLDRAEKLDVYLPQETFARPVPAVLLIHGGGWRIKDKADARERNIGQNLAAHGYAVFSINYLLNIEKKDPAGLHCPRHGRPGCFR